MVPSIQYGQHQHQTAIASTPDDTNSNRKQHDEDITEHEHQLQNNNATPLHLQVKGEYMIHNHMMLSLPAIPPIMS